MKFSCEGKFICRCCRVNNVGQSGRARRSLRQVCAWCLYPIRKRSTNIISIRYFLKCPCAPRAHNLSFLCIYFCSTMTLDISSKVISQRCRSLINKARKHVWGNGSCSNIAFVAIQVSILATLSKLEQQFLCIYFCSTMAIGSYPKQIS